MIKGDKIRIDIEKTKQEKDYKIFSFYDNVAFKTHSCYYDKYLEESRKCSNLEKDRNEWRRKYDNGGEFTSNFGDHDYEGEIREELRKREEELRNARVEILDIELELLKLEMKAFDRSSTITEIGLAFNLTHPRVFKENLDSKLWEGYQDWRKKVVKMEITIPKGKERSEELKQFKEEMVRAIKEAKSILIGKEKDKENQKKQKANSRVKQEITSAVEEIEELN